MARDMLHYAARASLLCGGPQSGHVSNEFHFAWAGTGTPATSDWNALATDVAGFYVTSSSAGHPSGYYLSPAVSRVANAHEVAIYALDMADPAHYYGSPVTVGSFTIATGFTGQGMPNEVAVVVSYRADYGSDPEHGGTTRPRADDRGRIYFGPLDAAASGTLTVLGLSVPVVSSALLTLLSAQISLLATTAFSHHWQMMVWSRKRQQMKEAISKAINQDFDTQERRGLATTLQTWVPM
jgi:hypothetical protein